MWLTGCGSAPSLAGNPHFAAETVTITAAGLVPSGQVWIPDFGTVVFRNELPLGDVEVELERPLGPSEACSTTLNFMAAGDSTVTQAIPPQGIAAICFHHAGEFSFAVRTPQGERSGLVTVGGGR